MKIPASSSILLATLAVSSSSSCLAAPAGDASQDTGIPPSSSTSRMHWGHCPPSSDTPVQQKSDAMRRAYASNLENRDAPGVLNDAEGQVAGLVQKLLPAPLGTTLANVIKSLSVNANSSDGGAAQGIDPQSVEAISAAAQEASRIANSNGTASTPAPQAQNANGTLPVNSQNDSGDQRSAPPSPNLPANPHNTPNPGVHAQANAPAPPAPPSDAPAPPSGAPAPPAGAPAPPVAPPALPVTPPSLPV